MYKFGTTEVLYNVLIFKIITDHPTQFLKEQDSIWNQKVRSVVSCSLYTKFYLEAVVILF